MSKPCPFAGGGGVFELLVHHVGARFVGTIDALNLCSGDVSYIRYLYLAWEFCTATDLRDQCLFPEVNTVHSVLAILILDHNINNLNSWVL